MGIARKFKALLFIYVFILLIGLTEVNAMNTGFSIEEMTENEKNSFISNIEITILTEAPTPKGISCFDVNKEEKIAIGQTSGHRKEVCIYDCSGTFLYGYAFKCSQSFAIEWDSEYVNIFFVRSDIIISLDSSGNILDAKHTQDTSNNNRYRNYLLYSTHRKIGDNEYFVKNDMGIFNWIATSYSQLVIKDVNGKESIIYDVTSAQFAKMMSVFGLVLIFLIVAIIVLVRQFIKLRGQGNG